MSDTGVKFGTACVDGAEGGGVWTTPENFTADDTNYAVRTPGPDGAYSNFNVVKLIIGGSVVGNNYATGSVTATETYYTFGDETNKWGLAPTAAQVNASDFGICLQMIGFNEFTNTLSLTGFTMGIPAEAVIDGIKVEIKGKYITTRMGSTVYMNCARITVYYTESAGSTSPSASISPSASPSTGWVGYTKGNYAELPADSTDLETAYTAQEVTDVSSKNETRVSQSALGQYAIHQFKDFTAPKYGCTLEWEGQTNVEPSTSTVFLQIYNRNSTTWVTVDSDDSSPANADFTLTAEITNLTDYRDGNSVISCRVYQLAK
jgi:hypothetical protein